MAAESQKKTILEARVRFEHLLCIDLHIDLNVWHSSIQHWPPGQSGACAGAVPRLANNMNLQFQHQPKPKAK